VDTDRGDEKLTFRRLAWWNAALRRFPEYSDSIESSRVVSASQNRGLPESRNLSTLLD
jgi:hypothetical protein